MTPSTHIHVPGPPDQPVRASAELDETDETVKVQFTVIGGHVAPGERRKVLEEVFALPQLADRRHLRASLPLGDVELLQGVHEHCSHVHTRAAGATCLVDAVVVADDHRPVVE
jgi:hypothetical protein